MKFTLYYESEEGKEEADILLETVVAKLKYKEYFQDFEEKDVKFLLESWSKNKFYKYDDKNQFLSLKEWYLFCGSKKELEKLKKFLIKKYHTVTEGLNNSEEIDNEEDFILGIGPYTVYRHISPKGKSYIGITSQKPHLRWDNGNGYKKQKKFWNAIKYYGWNKFKHEILETNLDKETAWYKEKYYISKFDSYFNGYNSDLGGPNQYFEK